MIRRLLIANRGEIAIRIARGARELGINPVGVYSDADERALFRESLDASLRIGPGPAAESYLDGAAIIAAARELRADAIHPGYGFLSERAPFAQAVIDAGLIFVGPTPAAIAAMGSKSDAKRVVRAAGVPVIEGYSGADQDDAVLLREATALGVPLVIKAIAGGGGRGMRVVEDLAQFTGLLVAARREALGSFGDDGVLLERYVRRPRHIEFQILGDEHGAMVHLGERDCSIQRRHQKVVEEAPSPALTSALRATIGDAAITAARSVGYTNAGTVEFLLDESGAYWFLEMNARLQVEHPVTEAVYGVDLVHEQLRIAAGEPLRLAQRDLVPHGASIEVRLNAEDAQHEYAPQAGTIDEFDAPTGHDVRVDAGVRDGSDIPIFYDSLLAKIIVRGDDRAAAVATLRQALATTYVSGIKTNLPLLRAIAHDDVFADGAPTTAFLDERSAMLSAFMLARQTAALEAAAGALLRTGFGWRASGTAMPIALDEGAARYVVTAERAVGGWRLSGDHAAFISEAGAQPHRRDATGIDVIVAGERSRFTFAPPPSAKATRASAVAGSGDVTAPMPGKIVSVAVKPGDTVKMHDLLVVLEAMKMEHRIDAPLDGCVLAVDVSVGDVVPAGAALATIGAQ